MSWEEYLKEIYYNPANAGSFGGPDKLSATNNEEKI